MAFATLLLPPFRHPWRIPMSQDLTTALPTTLLYLYDPLHLILHLVSVDDNAPLNADFLELRRIDTLILKLIEEVHLILALVNRGINKDGQNENDAGVLIERNGGCSSPGKLPLTRTQRLSLRMVPEGLLCPLLRPLLRGLLHPL